MITRSSSRILLHNIQIENNEVLSSDLRISECLLIKTPVYRSPNLKLTFSFQTAELLLIKDLFRVWHLYLLFLKFFALLLFH